MKSFKKNIFKTTIENIISDLEQGSISSISQSVPENGCALLLDLDCYFQTSINGAITSGDIVYSDIQGTIPIVGNNQYHRASLINFYIISINEVGVISVNSICA